MLQLIIECSKVSLDGGDEIHPSYLVIDTSSATSYIITFTATDQAGNTGTAEREVIVYDPNAATYDVAQPGDGADVATTTEEVFFEEEIATTTEEVIIDIATTTEETI